MDIKEAARISSEYLLSIIDSAKNMRLEEVEFDEDKKWWSFTFSYSDSSYNFSFVRVYKVVTIDDRDGHMISIKIRELANQQ